MSRTSLADRNCSFARSAEVLGDKWTLMVLRDAFYGVQTFSRFKQRLGIAPTVLTDRLARLCEADVLQKVQPTDGERHVYRLTESGRSLFPLVIALMQWGDNYLFGPGNHPIEVVDKESQAPVQALAVQARDGRFLSPRDVTFKPGPGADQETLAAFTRLTENRKKER